MAVARRRRLAFSLSVRAVLAAAALLLLACILAFAWVVRAPLPRLRGTLETSGVAAQVQVRRDSRGIPHILASSERDLFFAQGFACAQDRLWQMDLLRREAEGRLSEVFGSATLGVDEYFRTIGFDAVAAATMQRAGAEARAVLEAYAAGVNAAAADRELPLEFRLLGYRFRPWTPVDSIAVGLLITHDQDDNWRNELLRSDLARKLGSGVAAALMNNQIDALEDYVPGYGPAVRSAAHGAISAASIVRSAGESAPSWSSVAGVDFPTPVVHQGSNNWAASARRTTTGRPVLSNDTHLDHTLPSTWWIVQLRGGGFDVEGFTLPGLPGVIIGHNAHIAFGVTSAAEDVEDLYEERFSSAASDEYLYDGRRLRARHRSETIAAKGQKPITLDVLETRHGPVVRRDGKRALALAWTVLREGLNLSAVLDYDRAADWPRFRAALSHFAGPTLNFVYADVDGNIGYQDAGYVPARAAGDGSVPVDGAHGAFEWRGDVPFERLPHALNPPRGFVATANNQLVTTSFTPPLSRDFLAPYRIHEIVRRLSAARPMAPQAIGAIQADSYDFPQERIALAVRDSLAHSPAPLDRAIAEMLQRWNGSATVDAQAPTFLVAVEQSLERRMLVPYIGTELDQRYAKNHHLVTPIVRALDGDGSLAPIGITATSVRAALPRAVHDAERQFNLDAGSGVKRIPAWGSVNAAVYHHPLGVRWPLSLLNAPEVAQPGDVFTIFQSRPDFGPSMRFVADLSDWDDSSLLLTLGESGLWTDPHYDDQEDEWVNVAWHATPFTEAAIARDVREVLKLEPSE